ncbi:hypothetical protein C8Q78DRAFT_988723 [Trametes maxima]|nr:hypothetical protein C8Q78DRAFT_988723 [Trametes maxima]
MSNFSIWLYWFLNFSNSGLLVSKPGQETGFTGHKSQVAQTSFPHNFTSFYPNHMRGTSLESYFEAESIDEVYLIIKVLLSITDALDRTQQELSNKRTKTRENRSTLRGSKVQNTASDTNMEIDA